MMSTSMGRGKKVIRLQCVKQRGEDGKVVELVSYSEYGTRKVEETEAGWDPPAGIR